MPDAQVVGLKPWLPGPLGNSPWWNEPVRAERLAAFRIGVGLCLIFDIFTTYWGWLPEFFGSGGLCAPDVLIDVHDRSIWPFTFLNGLHSTAAWQGVMLTAVLSGLLLVVGFLPRLAALVGWLIMSSIYRQAPYLHCGGDDVRSILLFLLIFCPSGAVWSVSSWWRRRQAPENAGPVFIYPWVLRLLFIQLACIYFFTGVFKLFGWVWLGGSATHFSLGNANWARISFSQLYAPAWATILGTWVVLAWELSFPVLACWSWTRVPMLALGVFFHVMTGLTLRVASFPYYMLCLYLPLLPWENWLQRRGNVREPGADIGQSRVTAAALAAKSTEQVGPES